MSLITASEVNSLAFNSQIDSALIRDEIIMIAETKYIIPAVTQAVYNDLLVHPGFYATLIQDCIKPYLAYCVKFLLYSQYQLEITPNLQRADIVSELNLIVKAKKDLLVTQLLSGNYPLYIQPSKKLTAGFLVKRP